MSKEHSKLPFAIERDTGDGTAIDTTLWIVTAHDADKATVARIDEPDTIDERNAQYIVKACNAFPELVSVIKSLCDELESYCENCETVASARKAIGDV